MRPDGRGLRCEGAIGILLDMSDERKPTEDLKEGLSLIFRAAKSAAKQVDVNKIDKELDKAFTQVGRVVTHVGRAMSDGINTIANKPPWQRGEAAGKPAQQPGETEGEVHAAAEPKAEEKPEEKADDKKPDGSGG